MEIKNLPAITYLITGGCGFIGINLIDHLLRINPQACISVLDNLTVGTRDDLREVCNFREIKITEIQEKNAGVYLIVSDIRDFETCYRACSGINVMFHLAANTGVVPSVQNPKQDMECNVIGTFNLLEAAKQNGVKKFIFASSGASVGEIEPPIHEEKPVKPVSPYGASKLAGEGYCSTYFRTFGLPTITLRFGNVYGPRSKHKSSVVAKFFKNALNGEPLEIYGDGSQTRDFIYIDDLIQAILLSAEANVGGEIFQIATYKETSVNDIAEKIRSLVETELGRKIIINYGVPRSGDVRRNYSDISKAKRILKYEPKTEIETGLKKTFEYFKNKVPEFRDKNMQ